MQIIPAIIAKSFGELQEKIKLVEPFVEAVQLDIMDGIFVPNNTWKNPEDLEKLETDLFLEAHLMVENPKEVLDKWLSSKVERLIVHWEVIENSKLQSEIQSLKEKTHFVGKEFGLALNLGTSVDVVDEFIADLDMVLLMSINQPGFSGEEFQEAVIPKIVALRERYPNVKIGVDGGVNLENCKRLVEAGVENLYVGAGIFGVENIEEIINNLKIVNV